MIGILAITQQGCAGDTPLLNPSTNTLANSDGSAGLVGNPLTGQLETSRQSGPRQIIEKPTLAQVLKSGPQPEYTLGKPNAPVTVVKYASLTCPICAKFQRVVFPEFKKTYIDTGKVRLIIRQFPIGRSAGNATIALECAPKSKYLSLYNKFLSQQSKWVSQNVRLDAIYNVAKQVGMSRAKFDSCLKDQKLIKDLDWVKDRGRTLGIIGTPNFFVQNKRYKRALNMDGLRAAIDPLLTSSTARKTN